ncbi:DUF2796 domain-containing protein [Maricaulis sp.]|jgi:Protein of unknown function (DUF2796)|uniref:ZrgA family zinc uptake protein n=1 Tax=Maricaulis sp. TaxID=1486257 RepID=UPI0025CB7868|nr:DUF2796 domain-containing protein [Maricaulis sp.]MDF1768586.1 DUF2796 domain-containing protein [Maricaulis sp.]
MGPIEVLLSGVATLAADHHAAQTHAAHVHGEAQLVIAIDAEGLLQAEFEAPGDSVFGFEGVPRTEAQHQAVDQAQTWLADGNSILQVNRDAECVFQVAELDDEPHHDDNAHTDVRVTYHFSCASPDRLERMETRLFERFSRLEEVEAVFLSPDGQEGFDLTPASPGYRFQR